MFLLNRIPSVVLLTLSAIAVNAWGEVLNSPRQGTHVRPPVPSKTSAPPAAATVPFPHLEKVVAALPPAPEGVTDLRFGEIYRSPAGPRGLEFSEKLRGLNGSHVRIAGYMARQSQPMPWTLLLSPLPITLHEREYGFAEDLPPQTIHVVLRRNSTPIVPFTPGLLLLTGRLELGSREEPDGRVSQVRLLLDPPTPEQRRALDALAQGGTATATNLPSRPAISGAP